MKMTNETEPKRDAAGSPADRHHAEEMEDYAGGYIQAHHGTIAPWLLVVYLVLFLWALYYMVFYWGGLGPGLNY
jgi:hypothetical protein